MTTANIIRPEVTENYTALPNQLFGYGRYIPGLKPRDSSVLNYLLSKPENWKVVAKDIATALNISSNTVYKALSVLQDLGIASYSRNKFGHTHWLVSVSNTLYSSITTPHTKKPREEICDVLKNTKIKKNKKTTTRCVKNKISAVKNPPQTDYINAPITPEEIVVTPEIISPIIEEPDLPPQLSEIEKIAAKKSIIKANLDNVAYTIVLTALKTALNAGGIRSPIAYLNGLINKAKDGTLDVSKYDELKAKKTVVNRDEEIRSCFEKNGEKILLDLVTNGFVHISTLGYVTFDEAKKLGLINDVWMKKYNDIQIKKLNKLSAHKPQLKSQTIAQPTKHKMSAEEFEAKKNAQIEKAMAALEKTKL